MANLISNFWQRLSNRKGPWHAAVSVEAATDLPESIPAERAVLVGSDPHPKWIAFECPCNRGHRIMLNLDQSRRPSWRVICRQPLSLRPSVDALYDKQRCHFVLSNGRVIWIRERRRLKRGR